MSLTDWVTLDVGGRIISTYRSTLVSSPNSVLAKMFSPLSSLEPAKTHNGHYSIDSDPDIFNVILNWLRYQKVLCAIILFTNLTCIIVLYFDLKFMVHDSNFPCFENVCCSLKLTLFRCCCPPP